MPAFPSLLPEQRAFRAQADDSYQRLEVIKSRARAIGLEKLVGCHSFRATGLTEYVNAGRQLDIAQGIAGHAQLSTTKLYDRSQDRVTIAEIQTLRCH